MTNDINVLARYGRTFRLAGRLLPAEILQNAAELYAFCRAVDDLADETRDKAAAHTALLALRAAILSGTQAHPLAARLLALHRLHNVRLDAGITLIDTVTRDLGSVRVADERELLSYAYGAAGTVGLMMCAILGASNENAQSPAVDLGIAMQLTNIARDVPADVACGRIYLPSSWLPSGTEPATLLSCPSAVFEAVCRLLDLADERYRSAERGYQYLPPRVRPAIRAAARIYEEIGLGIRRYGPEYLRAKRHVVPMPRKLWLLAGCMVLPMRTRRPHAAPRIAISNIPGAGA